MSPRVPFVVVLVVAMGGAVVAGQAGEETPTATPAVAEAGVDMPAVPADDVLASTWYCAAGTAAEGGMADHRVVVLNPGDAEVAGTLTVHAGSVLPGSTDDSRGGSGSGDEGDGSETEEPDDESGSGGSGSDGDTGGDGGAGAGGRDRQTAPADGPTLGDAWSGQGEEGGTGRVEPAARERLRVPPGGRVELRLADLHRAPLAAALVELDGPAVVEHEVAGPEGRALGPCASSASPDWYLAWGATTRDAREVLVLFNPFPSVATVDIELSTDDGTREPVRYQGLPVPAGGVVGLDVGDEVTRREQIATTVRSRSGPIVVERLQAFDGSREVEGLSLALAAPSPLERWVFAHGARGSGRGERIVVYNPTSERAEVDVAVRPTSEGEDDEQADTPPPQPFGVTIRPGHFEVIDYSEEDRVVPDTNHSTVVESRNGVPIVAERVLTFSRGEPSSGDVAAGAGAALASRSWTFASLGAGSRPESRLAVYNPDSERPARLSVTGLVDGSEVAPDALQDIEVPAGDQREIELPDEVEGSDAALVVEADAPVVVERLTTTAGGLVQAVGPGLPGTDSAVSLSRLGLE